MDTGLLWVSLAIQLACRPITDNLLSVPFSRQLAALFRVPLNIFVVVSLLTGVSSSAREVVLSTCAIVLVVASLVTAVVVVPRVEGHIAGRGSGEERTDRVD